MNRGTVWENLHHILLEADINLSYDEISRLLNLFMQEIYKDK